MLALLLVLALTGQPTADAPKLAPNPQPWETAVRVKMQLPTGAQTRGSGTVIFSNPAESIVLTCGHTIHAPGTIEVELFDGTEKSHVTETLPGELVECDIANEVGLVKIHPGRVLPASPVAPTRWTLLDRMAMRNIGCSGGADVTVLATTVEHASEEMVSVYTGKPFPVVVCSGRPAPGRSGGALLTADGYIAGVCVASSVEFDTGLYATPASIRAILDRHGLSKVYAPRTAPVAPPAPVSPAGETPTPAPAEAAFDGPPVLQGVVRKMLSTTPRAEAKGEEGRHFQTLVANGDPLPVLVPNRPILVVIGTAAQRKPIMDAINGKGALGEACKDFDVQDYDPGSHYVRDYKATPEHLPMVLAFPGGSRVPAMTLLHYQRDPQDLVNELAAKRSQLRTPNPKFDPEKAAATGELDLGAWFYRNAGAVVLVGIVLAAWFARRKS